MPLPKYPIFVISKGRWESRLTSKALEQMKCPYKIVVEPQEFDSYASVIDQAKILVTPFSNLGLGSIPVRNFVWEKAVEMGAERFWTLDDNIRGFARLHENQKIFVQTPTFFRVIEDFADRYSNIAIAGPHYWMFAPRKTKQAPFGWNRRIYSCILLKTDLEHRWRGRYNEDTDLSLRVLKDGWCTAIFAALLAYKMTTLTMKGGNTDELYKADGRLKMAESLVEQHPDVATITWKWGRWQHQVDYRPFKWNRPILKKDAVIPEVCPYELELKVFGKKTMLNGGTDEKRNRSTEFSPDTFDVEPCAAQIGEASNQAEGFFG